MKKDEFELVMRYANYRAAKFILMDVVMEEHPKTIDLIKQLQEEIGHMFYATNMMKEQTEIMEHHAKQTLEQTRNTWGL